MSKCRICKKPLNIVTEQKHGGKIYCYKHYNEQLVKEKKEKKKLKDILQAKKAMFNAYNYGNKGELITNMIKSWKPRNCTTESQYAKSLKKFLDSELIADEIYVSLEHGLSMSRVDIVIGQKKPYRDFAIELKKDFVDSSKFDRLKGQIHTYVTSGFEHVIVLNVGKMEPKLETELKHYFKDMKSNYSSYSSNFDTIELMKK